VDAVNPATEEVCAVVAVCGRDDVDLAVTAARAAFDAYAATSLEHRIALVEKMITIFERRYDEMVTAISTELGAPLQLKNLANWVNYFTMRYWVKSDWLLLGDAISKLG
jgi:aldehyde dehydrogenase (NAD+)